MRYADLHVHTHYSDSTFSPEEVVWRAKGKGLSAIAICDHDSIDGIEPCITIGSSYQIEIIPGVELTVEKPDAEIHILGYFIGWRLGWFQKKLKELQVSRIERIHKMVEKLNKASVKIDAKSVFECAGKGTVGRMHMAQAMLKRGLVKNIKDAFIKYIGFMKPCYVPNVTFDAKDAIDMILKSGGVPVLAHPAVMCKDEHIPELAEDGLRGIEVYHPDHNSAAARHYEEIAKENGLLITGGSDCHGLGKDRILLGSVRVPYELVDKLREEAQSLKCANTRDT